MVYNIKREPKTPNFLRELIKETLSVDVKLEKSRLRDCVNARMIYSVILRNNGFTLGVIARSIEKHHTSIMHYIDTFNDCVDSDRELKRQYVKVLDAYKEDKFSLTHLTQAELISEIMSLRKENKLLSLNLEERTKALNLSVKNRERFDKIFKLIEDKTPRGQEEKYKSLMTQVYTEHK